MAGTPRETSLEEILRSIPSDHDYGLFDSPVAYSAAAEGSLAVDRTGEEEEGTLVQIPPALESNSQARAQLIQRFVDLHIGASSNARRIFAFEALNASNVPKHTAEKAMDTLCIAQIATTFQDSALMKIAKTMYGGLKSYLNVLLGRLGPHFGKIDLDDVIRTLHALTSCARFSCIQSEDFEWMQHTQTTLQIVEVFGWDAISLPTKKALYYNWKCRAFFEGLMRRVKVSFTEPSTPFTTEQTPAVLNDHALEVPGLLWRSDQFLEASQSQAISSYMVIRLLTEMGVRLSGLKHWYLQWMKGSPVRPPYRTIGTKRFEAFRTLCGDQFSTFPLAYDFSRPEHELDLRVYLMCVISLDQAVMAINAAFPEHCNSAQLKVQLREAEHDAESSAGDLCMLIPWITQPQNRAFGSIHSLLPLSLASGYYARHGKYHELTWCRKVQASLRAKYGIEVNYPKHAQYDVEA